MYQIRYQYLISTKYHSFNYHKQTARSAATNTKIDINGDRIVVRYFDEVELLDEDVRQMLNQRLKEAKAVYDKCIAFKILISYIYLRHTRSSRISENVNPRNVNLKVSISITFSILESGIRIRKPNMSEWSRLILKVSNNMFFI